MANQPKKYKKFVATAATATLVASAIVPVASAASFSDVSDSNEFAKFIDALTDEGIINGYPSTNTFKPGALLTRGQVVKMLGRWVENNGVELPSDWKTKAYFKDVPTNHKDQELVKYAALVSKAGVFTGAAGNLMAEKNITRQQMAKVLNGAYAAVNGQSLIEIAEDVDNVRIPDLLNASAEYEAAIQALMDLEISSTTSGNFRPLENVTRGQFSKFLYNTINFKAVDTAKVKAINATTVEVTFDEEVADVKALDFAIEGLTVSNAVVKQTDKKTVVLTTSAQTADVEYTVTVNGDEVGKFKGISAVVPTAIKTVVASQQGVIGKEVTLSAEVTVAEGQSKAGIPVTFNIVNDKSTNSKIEVEAITNDKGVATYSYTRYYNGIDDVVAYATSKSSVKDNAKVYWASSAQLTIEEVKEGKTAANGSKKSYEIKGDSNSVVFVAFEENLDIKSNKIVDVQVTSAVGYIDEDGNYKPYSGSKKLTPYELSTGAAQYVVIELDKKGEGSLIITGSDASVTPVVYEATSIGDLDLDKLDRDQAKVKKLDVKYGRTLLQAKADTVKFEQNDTLALDVKALGTEDAAQASGTLPTAGTEIDEENDFGLGGREYEVTARTKDGELASKGSKAYVVFGDIKGTIKVIIDGVVHNVTEDTVLPALTVDKDGKTSFRVIGTGKDSYATPTVFLNTEGSTSSVKLDKKDVQVEAETTYFTEADVEEAVIKVLNAEFGAEVKSLQAGKKAYAVYQSVDQNGFAYGTGKKYDVTFELSTTFGELKVTGEDVHNVGRTYTYETTSDTNGRAVVEFTADSATTVNIDISGARNVLPAKVATVKFTEYATGETTGVIASVDTDNDTLTIGSNVYSYADAKEYKENGSKITKSEFEKLIVKPNARISITKDADGKLTFDVLAAANPADIPVTVTSAVAVDTDGDSIADKINLTFSKPVDEAKLTSAYLGTVTLTSGTVGTTVVSDSNATDNKVTLSVTGATGLGLGTLTLPALVDLGVDLSDFAKYTTSLGVADVPTMVAASGSTAPGNAGTAQVETLTAAAATATGDAVVTVQAAGFNGGNPLNINVPVVALDADTVVASKVFNALKANPTVTSFFNVTTATNTVVLTAKTAAANDPTTVITLANNIATPAVSADTTAGSAPTAEVVTVTVSNGATNAGTVTATVTDGSFTRTVNFQVAAGDTIAQVAGKLYAALLGNTDITARYDLGVTTTTVTLTNKTAGTTPATVVTVQ